jgi:benzaldehyde dehydrogenase (NAD)
MSSVAERCDGIGLGSPERKDKIVTTTTEHTSMRDGLGASAVYLEGAFHQTVDRLEVLEKATGAVLGTVGRAGMPELETAVAAARRAQQAWAEQPYSVRVGLLRAVASRLEAHASEFADVIVRETGSIRGKAEYEVGGSIDELVAAAALAGEPRGEVLASGVAGRLSVSEREPVGVVGVITPWNFPLILAMRVIAPAIALGNAVILKPSPETPISGGLLIARVFEEADAPSGLFQVLSGDQELSEGIVSHRGIDMIHFTGSSAVGSQIAATAGGLLKRVSLELGGNNAFVVLSDADPDYASMLGAWSSFHYQGQTCISAGRHLVHESLMDAYTAAISARARKIRVGDPADEANGLGPMINERQAARAQDLLGRSVAQGAWVITGGTRDGLFFRPTVVVDVKADMPIWTEETFAPIVPIMSFSSDEEAIELVNDTPYGLVNAVVTPDEARGRRFARASRSGMVQVNDATPVDEAVAPFGGIGASGLGGRIGGTSNLHEFTEQKWISVQQGAVEYPY